MCFGGLLLHVIPSNSHQVLVWVKLAIHCTKDPRLNCLAVCHSNVPFLLTSQGQHVRVVEVLDKFTCKLSFAEWDYKQRHVLYANPHL